MANNGKDVHRYDDMLHLPHHQSLTHPHMSHYDRAAQFSPFAALTGYDDALEETARQTDAKIILDESSIAALNEKLGIIAQHLDKRPEIVVTYFVSDGLKDGGAYITATGTVKKIDQYNRKIVFYDENSVSDGKLISIDDISAIDGDLFGEFLP